MSSKKIPNISISKFTKFDEILEGRVKTLHPIIHAGILAKDKKSTRDGPGAGRSEVGQKNDKLVGTKISIPYNEFN